MVDTSSTTNTSGDGGPRFGRFKVLFAGRGTPWGEFFLVTDGTLIGRLALFAPWLSEDPSYRSSFERMAATLIDLEHPNLGRNWEFGITKGRLYAVEEEFPGTTVREISRLLDSQSSATPQLVRRAAIELSGALHVVHTLTYPNGDPINLLYRAPLPGRIYFTPNGDIKMAAPFAWPAAWVNLNRFKVQDRETHFFCSPEDILGEHIGISDDLYALARTLLVMLHPAPIHATAQRAQEFLDASLAELRGVDPQFAAVLDKALAPDPKDRFHSAKEMTDALEPLSAHEFELSQAEIRQFLAETHSATRKSAGALTASLQNISRVQAPLRSLSEQPNNHQVIGRRAPTVDIPMSRAPSYSDVRRFDNHPTSTPPSRPPTPRTPTSSVGAFDAPPPIAERHAQLTPEQLDAVTDTPPPSDPQR